MKVQITKLPLEKAEFGKQVDGSLSLKATAFGGADFKKFDKKVYNKVKSTTGAVPREEANLEAEGGETAYGPISGQSIPDHLKIIGKRHSEGGVPMNLPDDTFIFSDTAALKISDPSILAMFNRVPKKGGYTPAELAKPYDINKYKDILFDPDTGKLEKNTATIMIKNYIMKLGALALVQESMKGFPQGIPEMAKPYMEANNIAEEDLMPELKEQAEAMAQQMPQQQQMPMGDESMEQMPDDEMAEAQYPEQMPSGAPVASPEMLAQMQGQGMPPEGMMQQPPMRRGGYIGIPYAQDGLEQRMELNRTDPATQDYIRTMNKYYERQGLGEYLPYGTGPMNYNQLQNWDEMNDILFPNDPRNQYNSIPSSDSPDYRLQRMQKATEDCPCMKDAIVQGVPQKICVPCEQMPMAAYGMEMGGYDFPYSQSDMGSSNAPTYAKGGLIKAQGGIEITPEIQNQIDTQWSGNKEAYLEYMRKYNYIMNNDALRKKIFEKYKGVIEDETSYTGKKKGNWYDSLIERDEEAVIKALLDQEKRNAILRTSGFKAAEAGQSPYANKKWITQKTKDYLAAHPELGLVEADFDRGHIGQAAYQAYNKAIQELNETGYNSYWADQSGVNDENVPGMPQVSGIENVSSNTTLGQFLYGIDEEPTPEDGDPKAKEKVCRCTDPKTGKVSEVVIAADAICECSGMKSEEIAIPPRMPESPHFSIPAKLNILRNALMRTKPAATNAVLSGRAQVAPAYEEYQTKVDQALAAQNQLSNALMYGVSGASATKQAQLKDLLGKSLNASISSVADVASRNVDRQRETNQQNATIDNTTMLANRAALKEGLDAQTVRKDTETANKNKKGYNTYQAVIDAYKEMAQRQNQGILYPQYASTYDEGFVYPTGVEKPFNEEVSPGFNDRYAYWTEEAGGDKTKGFDMAWKEARLKSKFGGTMAHGGYVLASNAFPFLL
jgi:hypothetical protein